MPERLAMSTARADATANRSGGAPVVVLCSGRSFAWAPVNCTATVSFAGAVATSRTGFEGQLQRDGGALGRLALERDPAPVGGDDALDDRQPQAAATLVPRA